MMIMLQLKEEKSEGDILQNIQQIYMNINLVQNEEVSSSDFNANRKSETYITTALKSVVRCACRNRLMHGPEIRTFLPCDLLDIIISFCNHYMLQRNLFFNKA